MILCPSIQPATTDEAVRLLGEYRRTSRLIEIRIDTIRDLNLPRLLSSPRPDVIITHRLAQDNGRFNGTEPEHFSILAEAARLGAEYIDLELRLDKKYFCNIRTIKKNVKIICSHHDFRKTPDDLYDLYKKMRSTDADILKIAVTGNSITDNHKMFGLLHYARKSKVKIIGICMGESGEISRILGGKFGSYLSFAAASESETTGPGQLSLEQMKKVFRADRINGSTKVFGLVGNPVKYSRGIFYHNNVFSRTAVNAVYVNFLINNLTEFLPHARDYVTGISVTMPFKKDISTYVGRFDSPVENLGIINTVIQRRKKLIGYNTDLSALIKILKRLRSGPNSKIIVLGTGSMAKTAAHACASLRAAALIVGRNSEKAKALADEYNYDFATFADVKTFLADIIVNATSAGMGNISEMPPIPPSLLKNKMTVIDVVSNPQKTRLISEAEKAGCGTVTGGDIFSIQARMQSNLFLEACR